MQLREPWVAPAQKWTGRSPSKSYTFRTNKLPSEGIESAFSPKKKGKPAPFGTYGPNPGAPAGPFINHSMGGSSITGAHPSQCRPLSTRSITFRKNREVRTQNSLRDRRTNPILTSNVAVFLLASLLISPLQLQTQHEFTPSPNPLQIPTLGAGASCELAKQGGPYAKKLMVFSQKYADQRRGILWTAHVFRTSAAGPRCWPRRWTCPAPAGKRH